MEPFNRPQMGAPPPPMQMGGGGRLDQIKQLLSQMPPDQLFALADKLKGMDPQQGGMMVKQFLASSGIVPPQAADQLVNDAQAEITGGQGFPPPGTDPAQQSGTMTGTQTPPIMPQQGGFPPGSADTNPRGFPQQGGSPPFNPGSGQLPGQTPPWWNPGPIYRPGPGDYKKPYPNGWPPGSGDTNPRYPQPPMPPADGEPGGVTGGGPETGGPPPATPPNPDASTEPASETTTPAPTGDYKKKLLRQRANRQAKRQARYANRQAKKMKPTVPDESGQAGPTVSREDMTGRTDARMSGGHYPGRRGMQRGGGYRPGTY